MEAEERPTKLRKLGHGEEASLAMKGRNTAPLLQQDATLAIPAPAVAETCKPEESATNVADPSPADSGAGELNVSLNAQAEAPNGEIKPMSKSQLKKLRKKEEWEAGREYRKARRREKIVERRARKRAVRREEEEEARQRISNTGNNGDLQKPEKPKYRRPVRLPVTIVIDCGFDELMMEKERISLGSQLTRSYSDNYRAPYQSHLMVSSWGGLLKERFDTVLSKQYMNWKGVTFLEADFVEAAAVAKVSMSGPSGGRLAGVFEKYARDSAHQADQSVGQARGSSMEDSDAPSNIKLQEDTTYIASEPSNGSVETPDSFQRQEPVGRIPDREANSTPDTAGEIVYLTSDSPYTLEELKPYSTYIVGGLVDKNRHKGICYKTACDKGVKTAKLPIGQYMEMQSRFVLATNHVVEIMVRWLECGDWGEAFMKVIPKRKGGKLKEVNDACTPDAADEADEPSSDETEQVAD